MRLHTAIVAALVAFCLFWGAGSASGQVIYGGIGYTPYPGGYYPPPAYNYNAILYSSQSGYYNYGPTYSYQPIYPTPYLYGTQVYSVPVYRYGYPMHGYPMHGVVHYPARPYHRYR